MVYLSMLLMAVYVVAHCAASAVMRRRHPSAPPAEGIRMSPSGSRPRIVDEADDADQVERMLTRRLMDGALTRDMYRHAMATLASRDAVRQPLHLPRV